MKFRERLVMIICISFCMLLVFSSSIGAQQEGKADSGKLSTQNSQVYSENESMKLLCNPNGRVLGVSSRGDRVNFPENSLEAVRAAAKTGIDFILVDIRKTADGVLVLFGDDTTQRMFLSNDIREISSLTYDELSKMPLLNAKGGNTYETEFFVPTLDAALADACSGGYALILNTPEYLLQETGEALQKNSAYKYAAVMTPADADSVSRAFSGLQNIPLVIGEKKGNIIFSVNSYVKDYKAISAVGINLKTTNRYGINFTSAVLKNFNGSMRAVANTSDPQNCGAREDSEKWWNDLISRGYSVIVTDYPELFNEYLSRCESARERLLISYREKVENFTLPDFKNEALNDYKKAYNDAVTFAKELLSDESSSYQDLCDAYTGLLRAAAEISINFNAIEEGSAGKTVTAPRILLCIAAAIAVILVQIYFYKRRK